MERTERLGSCAVATDCRERICSFGANLSHQHSGGASLSQQIADNQCCTDAPLYFIDCMASGLLHELEKKLPFSHDLNIWPSSYS